MGQEIINEIDYILYIKHLKGILEKQTLMIKCQEKLIIGLEKENKLLEEQNGLWRDVNDSNGKMLDLYEKSPWPLLQKRL